MTCTYLFDIDGVLIDNSYRINKITKERLPKHLFYSNNLMSTDKPRLVGINELLNKLKKGKVIIYSGRPIKVKNKTTKQLKEAGIPLERIHRIILRDNLEKDALNWKKELIEQLLTMENVCEIHEDEVEILEFVYKRNKKVKLYYHKNDVIVLYNR